MRDEVTQFLQAMANDAIRSVAAMNGSRVAAPRRRFACLAARTSGW